MKQPKLQNLTVEQLVESFRDWSYKQSDAIGVGGNGYAKASAKLAAIGGELRRRGPEAQRALLPLLECKGEDTDPWRSSSAGSQCRYNAAWELLQVEPDLAQKTLRNLAVHGSSYARFLARMTLRTIEDGSLKLP